MSLTRVSTVVYCLCIVTELTISVPLQQSNSGVCDAVKPLLSTLGVSQTTLLHNPTSDVAGSICGSSCCPPSLEEELLQLAKVSMALQFEEHVTELATDLRNHALRVQDNLISTIRFGKVSMLATFSDVYPRSRQLAQEPTIRLFSEFERFFQSQLSEAGLELAMTTFFDHLLPVLYRSSEDSDLTDSFVRCLSRQRQRLRPFGEVPPLVTQRVLKMFGVARLYLQSLHEADSVLRSPSLRRWSRSCLEAATRLRSCRACHQLAGSPPCVGFCHNVVRGCTAQLSVLQSPWDHYVTEVKRLAASLQQANNISLYLSKMDANLATATSNTWDTNGRFKDMLKAMCASSGGPDAAPESFTGGTGAGFQNSSDRKRRFSSDELDVNLPFSNITDTPESMPHDLSTALSFFSDRLEASRFFFDTISDAMCSDSASSSECWNGRRMGRYVQEEQEPSLSRQTLNPEVRVTDTVSPEIRRLTERLNTVRQVSRAHLRVVPLARALSPYERQLHHQRGDELPQGSGSGHWSPRLVIDDEYPEYSQDYYEDEDYEDDAGYSSSGSGSGIPDDEDLDWRGSTPEGFGNTTPSSIDIDVTTEHTAGSAPYSLTAGLLQLLLLLLLPFNLRRP